MPIQQETPYIEYIANGLTTTFALNFTCPNKDELIVFINNISVSGWALNNNSVTFTDAPTNGAKVEFLRSTKLERSTNYQSYNDTLRPDVLNDDLDRVWRKMQEMQYQIDLLSNP